MQVWSQVALAGILGGLLAIERRAFLQAMFSRPLVTSLVVGLAFGDVPTGLAVGVLLELYYLGSASLGAAIPEHDTLVASCSAAMASAMAQALGVQGSPAVWSLAVLACVPLGKVGRAMDRRVERFSGTLAQRSHALFEEGQLDRAMRLHMVSLTPLVPLFGAVTAGFGLLGHLAAPAFERLPLSVYRGLEWAYPAMASVAAAIAVRGSHARRALTWAGAAAAVVTLGVLAAAGWGRQR
jgi:PTS system mannose-specific IIC component